MENFIELIVNFNVYTKARGVGKGNFAPTHVELRGIDESLSKLVTRNVFLLCFTL